MSCDNAKILTIIRGEDRTIKLKIITPICDGSSEALDLTGNTAIRVRFKNEDDTALEKTIGSGVVVLSATGGKISVSLSDAETDLLKLGKDLSFTVEIDFGAVTRIVNFNNVLDVLEPYV